jgi:hypothetical protein
MEIERLLILPSHLQVFARKLDFCQRAVKTSQGWADENQPL